MHGQNHIKYVILITFPLQQFLQEKRFNLNDLDIEKLEWSIVE